MKTKQKIKEDYAKSKGFYGFLSMVEALVGDDDSLSHHIDGVMQAYAHQALDLASERADLVEVSTEKWHELGEPECVSNGMGDTYIVDKDSILKLKEEI